MTARSGLVLALLALVAGACTDGTRKKTSAAPTPGGEAAPADPAPTDPASPVAPDLEPYVGYYELALDPDAGWHRHFLTIEAIGADGVRGRIQIDRGIGPEARAPMPDEGAFVYAYQVPTGDDPLSLALRVDTGTDHPVPYRLALALCPAAGAGRCGEAPEGAERWLAGTAEVGDPSPRRLQALAPMRPQPEAEPGAWPAWGELPPASKP